MEENKEMTVQDTPAMVASRIRGLHLLRNHPEHSLPRVADIATNIKNNLGLILKPEEQVRLRLELEREQMRLQGKQAAADGPAKLGGQAKAAYQRIEERIEGITRALTEVGDKLETAIRRQSALLSKVELNGRLLVKTLEKLGVDVDADLRAIVADVQQDGNGGGGN